MSPARRRGRRAVLVAGRRTPFCKAGGVFEPLSAPDLGRIALTELLLRSGVGADEIDAVVFGCAGSPADAANPARVIALRSGLDHRTPALTVQRNCASGMEAIVQALRLVEGGEAQVVACGGMESMSNYPIVFPRSYRRRLGKLARSKSVGAKISTALSFRARDFKPEIALLQGLTDPTCGLSMGQTAEVLARELGIGRDEQDAHAVLSHQRAAKAAERLAAEIVPVVSPGAKTTITADDAVRPEQSVAQLAKLRPVFARQRGTVTPGNACSVTDGACALLVADEAWAEKRGLTPLARLVTHSVAGVAPERMGLGPAAALPRALKSAGWTLDELGLVEINEAFAVQVLACVKVLADAELMKTHADWPEALGELSHDRLNVSGGAIALGHPVGVSGARIVLRLAHDLNERGLEKGAASLCVGGGQGQAVLLERPADWGTA
ncbi:MAG: thiolase family protein [Acidobacteriota bacterium]